MGVHKSIRIAIELSGGINKKNINTSDATTFDTFDSARLEIKCRYEVRI
jgi:nicotinate-nucleotide pyrophosphorylase